MTTATATLKELGQMAFALAVNQTCPGVYPDAEKVEFTPGVLYHQCRYDTGEGLIFKGNFYHRDLQNAVDGTVCIGEVEDHHDAHAYSFPFSWHHLFGIPDEYSQMKDREIIEWTSDENSRHMQKSGEILYLIEWLFKNTDKLVDGTTKEQVASMTQFKKIELLERLHAHPEMFGTLLYRDISSFLEDVNKDGFRTADDYEQPDTELMLGQCLQCHWSQQVHYSPGNEESERQAVEELQKTHDGRNVCNNIITYA